ncbi:ABC transporter substrate-binding protein [Robertmurraya kyonggiensis]|uniref:Nitrate ABC transporter substrate-binding protein n=1 Tax=Robertmurraya kyonggiensis TaxID=1037680 RepID=A0A4U1D131_9BACI|nr:ABC transporter substrate-binding protein [Robertmurraya kyonggiensis]TKC14716.1 nitrate ABC transporter substrate-binding protein [Robertmurraya kyonggiensis]
MSIKKHPAIAYKIITVFVFLVLLQACSSETSNGEKTLGESSENGIPSVLNYGYIGLNELNLPSGAAGWGFHKGIIQEELKKHGITEITLTAFPNGPDLNESLISGRLHFGSLGDTPAILAKSSGADTRLIAQPSKNNVGYLIGKKDGPKTIKELEGKTIAIQKGSFMHRYVIGLLQQEGVKNYNLVHMLRPDGEAALTRGEVDAMTNSGVNALAQIEQGFTHLDDALSHPDLLGTSVTVASGEFLKKFPDFPKVWNEAIKKSLDDLKQHEDEYYELMAEISQTTPELIKETAPIEWIEEEPFTDDGLALLDGTKDFLVEEKLAQKDFEIKDWIIE